MANRDTITIGNHRFEVTILPSKFQYSFIVEHFENGDLNGDSNGKVILNLGNMSQDDCQKRLRQLKPKLEKYLISQNIPILREVSEEYKMFHGLNAQPCCSCCGRSPESCMHYRI